MGIFHGSLDDKVEDNYTFKDVIKSPRKSAWDEIFRDLNYEELFEGSKKRKSRLNDLVVLASFGLTSIPHELIHAGTNLLTGGTNEKIVINSFYGGDLVHKLYSGIDAEFLLPIIGGYVKIAEYGSTLGQFATGIAPYVLTPLGIYMVAKGKEKKSLPLAIAGSGALIAHAGGIIGDFFNFGRTAMYQTADFMANTVGYDNFDASDSWMSFPLAMGGFYVGSKALSFTYRSFKAGVNAIRNRFGNKNDSSGPSMKINLIGQD